MEARNVSGGPWYELGQNQKPVANQRASRIVRWPCRGTQKRQSIYGPSFAFGVSGSGRRRPTSTTRDWPRDQRTDEPNAHLKRPATVSVLRRTRIGNAHYEDNSHGSYLRLAMHQLFSRMVGGATNKSIDPTRADPSSPIELRTHFTERRNSRCSKTSTFVPFTSRQSPLGVALATDPTERRDNPPRPCAAQMCSCICADVPVLANTAWVGATSHHCSSARRLFAWRPEP